MLSNDLPRQADDSNVFVVVISDWMPILKFKIRLVLTSIMLSPVLICYNFNFNYELYDFDDPTLSYFQSKTI